MKYLFHKPFGVLSQFTAEVEGQRTLSEFQFPPNVYAAGRLDQDSEGLLLLTDEGPLIKKLLDPQNGHEREYWAQLEGAPKLEDLERLEKGVMIGNYKTRPAKADFLPLELIPKERNPPIRFRKNIPTTWIRLILHEGKNRQVRRMSAAVGFPTLRLMRWRIDDWTLVGLDEGVWKKI